MNTSNRQDSHNEIGHIFKDLLPAQGMPERPEQIALSHRMLDTMLDGNIALCDAGTGIGKTYAYLVAGTAYQRFLAGEGKPLRPILFPPPASPSSGPCGTNTCPFSPLF